jgi:circadian clock protein KaiB
MTPHVNDAPQGDAPSGASDAVVYVLTLFVTGQSVRSQRAVANLRSLCDGLGDRCELTVIDVLERPQVAEDERILATPTVIRHRPLPLRRVIGDLSDRAKVLLWLDLPQPLGAGPTND